MLETSDITNGLSMTVSVHRYNYFPAAETKQSCLAHVVWLWNKCSYIEASNINRH